MSSILKYGPFGYDPPSPPPNIGSRWRHRRIGFVGTVREIQDYWVVLLDLDPVAGHPELRQASESKWPGEWEDVATKRQKDPDSPPKK